MPASEFADWLALAEMDYEREKNPNAPASHEAQTPEDQFALMKTIEATRQAKAERKAKAEKAAARKGKT